MGEKMKLILALLFVFTGLAHADTRYNFLLVVDNSGSMLKQRKLVDQHFGEFVARLKKNGISHFQMGITTTDFFAHGGQLKTLSGDYLVTSELSDPAKRFSELLALVEESATSFWEQGLEASLATIQTYPNSFLVPNEPLVVIYISDEEDYSCAGDCFGVEPENNKNWKPFPVERYINFFNGLKKDKNIEVSIFPIVGLLEGNCSVSSYGTRYLKLRANMQLGTGIPGSICESDVVESLLRIPEKLTSPNQESPKWTLDPIPATTSEDIPMTLNLSPYAVGNQLKFSKVTGPSWGIMGANGVLTGTPHKANVGSNIFTVRITDGKGLSADTSVVVRVTHAHHPPVWKDPINLGNAQIGSPFLFDLGEMAQDPDGDTLTFSVLSGPPWLTLTQNGVLSGTPTNNDIGISKITVRACDPNGMCSTAEAVIVVPKN
jgi:hypothetical protein